MDAEAATKLRAKFPKSEIGKLPRAKKDANGKKGPKGHCKVCGGWHELPAIHLDFVGHGHITNRILEVDPDYEFGPVLDVNKRPVTQQTSDGMEVLYYLTIKGSTKYEWGEGPNMKEISSDAIRRCAMRFGVALDLWAKEPLHADEAPTQDGARSAPRPASVERAPLKTTKAMQDKIRITAQDLGIDTELRHRITRLKCGVTSSKDVDRKDMNMLLDAFKGFAKNPEASLAYLENVERLGQENAPTTAAQAIREGTQPSLVSPADASLRETGRADSPSTSSPPPEEVDGEHILTREKLEPPGQTALSDAIPD